MHTAPTPVNPCPRCQSELMPRIGGWRGLVDMCALDDERMETTVYHCLMCGHYEDAVVRQNRLLQRAGVPMDIHPKAEEEVAA